VHKGDNEEADDAGMDYQLPKDFTCYKAGNSVTQEPQILHTSGLSLSGQSLSSKSKEITSAISKASMSSLTSTVDKKVEPAKIRLTPNLDRVARTLTDPIPKLDSFEKNETSMNPSKQGSVEVERDGTLVKKELSMPAEGPGISGTNGSDQSLFSSPLPFAICSSGDFNVVNGEADRYQTVAESCCSESGNTESSNSIYEELCDLTEEDANGHQEVVGSTLDPIRQALVDRVMEEFWIIFNHNWDVGFRECAGASSTSSSVPNGSGNLTSESSLPLGSRKRQREDDDLPNDKNGRDYRGPGGSIAPSSGPEESTRFACPFRKHNTQVYSVYSHPICALSHWETISRVKYVI
jgi:hypothetical protein